jgi:L-ribulose-5-phosphate 3-epimerase
MPRLDRAGHRRKSRRLASPPEGRSCVRRVDPVSATFAVNTYPYAQRFSARQCLAHLAEHGHRLVELMLIPGHYWPSLDDQASERRAITGLLRDSGLRILTLNQPNLDINLSSGVPEMRQHSCRVIADTIRLAAEWNAIGVVMNPGKDNPVLPASSRNLRDWFRRSLDVVTPIAEQAGVQLIVKNHPLSYLYRAEELAAFFDDYGWNALSIGYDFANGAFGREDPHSALHCVAGHLRLVYAADTGLDTFRHGPVGTGIVEFSSIAKSLHSLGYAGETILEILDDDPDRALSQSMASLQGFGWPVAAHQTGMRRNG